MIKILFFSAIFFSCATSPLKKGSSSLGGLKKFLYSDANGKYTLVREVKKLRSQLITRTKLFSREKSGQSLETSITVSKIGTRRSGEIAMMPEASQFFVWFDKNKYTSNIKIDRVNRKLILNKKGPKREDNITKKFALPKSEYICFFSQLPECILAQNLLVKSQEGKIGLSIIWDSFPFNKEQYEGMVNRPVIQAEFYFSEKTSTSLRFELDIGNQILFYHFDKNLKFEKMFWVSQGLSVSALK